MLTISSEMMAFKGVWFMLVSSSLVANGLAFDCVRPTRRAFLATTTFAPTAWAASASTALARAPGSSDVAASLEQIKNASVELRKLQSSWGDYAIIDAEGRAGDVDRCGATAFK